MKSSQHDVHTSSGTSAPGRVGMWLSFACAVHCMAMPVLFLIAPALSARMGGLEWLEWGTVGLAFALTLIQLWPEYLIHRKPGAIAMAATGLALLLCGLILEEKGLDTAMHMALMVSGSLFMAGAFYKGHRLRHHAHS